ncbi:hypothetical protein BH11BAC2_BH11BAC2_10290 [soil metagenome]
MSAIQSDKTQITKAEILNHCRQQIIERIEVAETAIQSARDGMLNDTKSSAGDKHETSRAMSQIAIEQNQNQLQKLLDLRNEIDQINIQTKSPITGKGSLIQTNQGIYFLGPGIGKIQIQGIELFAISLQSPLGNCLHLKKEGDSFQFQNRSFNITKID